MLIAGLLILMAAVASLPGRVASAPASGRTLTCAAFGYSFTLPQAWEPTREDCAKPAARIVTTPGEVAVIGAQIANYYGASQGFQATVTQDLARLGLPTSNISFGQQILNGYNFSMALYAPPANRIGKRLWAYIVGTQAHGVDYVFQGYIFTDQPLLVSPLLSKIRDIFNTVRFSTGTSPVFARAARAARPASAGLLQIDDQTLGLLIMAVLFAGTSAAILLMAARKQPAVQARSRRR
jgi:hypothetical protein